MVVLYSIAEPIEPLIGGLRQTSVIKVAFRIKVISTIEPLIGGLRPIAHILVVHIQISIVY